MMSKAVSLNEDRDIDFETFEPGIMKEFGYVPDV